MSPCVSRTRFALAAAAVMLGLTAAGCGGSGPLQVTTGMTFKEVRATAGPPLRVDRENPRNPDCWVYGDHVAVCFKYGRVDYVGP